MISQSTKVWTYLLIVLIICLTGLGSTGCSLNNPGMPQWDIPVILPFSTQIYDLEGLIADSSNFAEDGVGVLFDSTSQQLSFVYQDSIPWNSLPDSLLMFAQENPENFAISLDTIIVDYTDTDSKQLEASAIFPDLEIPGTHNVPQLFIPPQSRQIPGIKFDSIEAIHVVSPDGGELKLKIDNGLNVVWDSLMVDILLAEPVAPEDSLLGSSVFYNIGIDEEQLTSMDLSGKTIRDSLLIRVNGWGGDQGDVLLEADDALSFDVWIDSLRSDYVSAVLEEQKPIEKILEFELDQNDWITSAEIESGAIILQIENRMDVDDSVYVEFPALRDLNGDPISKTLLLHRATGEDESWYYEERIVLDNYNLLLDLPDPLEEGSKQLLKAYTTSIIKASGMDVDGVTPRKARLSTLDSLLVTYYVEDLVFTSITAVAKAKEIEIKEITQAVDIWETQPNLQEDLSGFLGLDDVSISVDLNSNLEYPVLLDLSFEAKNSSLDPPANTFTFNHQQWVDPLITNIQIDSVQQLINMLPDTISITGMAYIGRDYITPESGFEKYEPHSIERGDGLSGLVEIISPLRIFIGDTTTINPTPEKFGEVFDNPLESFTLSARIRNTMPLGGRVFLLAGEFQDSLEAKDNLTWDNVSTYALTSPILIAPTEGVEDTIYSISVVIDEESLNLFSKENVYLRQIVRLFPTDGIMEALISDYLQVSVSAEVLYHVGGE